MARPLLAAAVLAATLIMPASMLLVESAAAEGVLMEPSYVAALVLAPKAKAGRRSLDNSTGPLATGVAFDGASLWTAAGGATDTVNLVDWGAAADGAQPAPAPAQHTPQLDIRSIWTQQDADGGGASLYADAFSDDHVYRLVAGKPGTFEPAGVTLSGAEKDVDSPVLYRAPSLAADPPAGLLVALDGGGAVLEYDAASGEFVRDVPLINFGAEPGETDWPSYVRFAVAQLEDGRFFYLTYSGDATLFAWDADGYRVGSATLEGAGTSEASYHSISYAKGMAWVIDESGGSWRGYKLSFPPPPPPPAAKAPPAAELESAAAESGEQQAGGDAAEAGSEADEAGSAPAASRAAGDPETCPMPDAS